MVLGHTGVPQQVQCEYYQLVIEKYPRDVDALTAIGNTYNADARNPTEAITYFESLKYRC